MSRPLRYQPEALRVALFSSLGLLGACAGTSGSDNRVDRVAVSKEREGDAGQTPRDDTVSVDGGRGPREVTGPDSEVVAPAPAAPRACGEEVPVLTDGENPTGRLQCLNGVVHRAERIECASELPRASNGVVDVSYGFCHADTDCGDGIDAFCGLVAIDGGLAPGCVAACVADEDCEPGFVCECGSPAGSCVQATCSTNADCAEGMLCSHWTATSCGVPLLAAYACQHPDDTCLTNDDCAHDEYCDAAAPVRQCAPVLLAPCGRPFLVSGRATTASAVASSDWGDPPADPVLGLDPETRKRLADRWSTSALLEHASVAAFARFTLQLLGLGAPAALVAASADAMADEIAHARMCFALASRYGGAGIGPGSLPITGALDSRSLLHVTLEAFHEGCVGETVAALQAAEAFEHSSDLLVRAALERIRRDELAHAALAWRFVAWAIECGGEPLRRRLEREVEALAADFAAERSSPSTAPESMGALAHGQLSEPTQALLARRAMLDVVVPCARAVLGGQTQHRSSAANLTA